MIRSLGGRCIGRRIVKDVSCQSITRCVCFSNNASSLSAKEIIDHHSSRILGKNPSPPSPSTRSTNLTTTATTTTEVLSSLSNVKCIEYVKGWAWQQVLMSHRLHTRRQLKNKELKQQLNNTESLSNDAARLKEQQQQQPQAQDNDYILLLEHAPVYTLGRGANEDHLTFLNTSSTSCCTTTGNHHGNDVGSSSSSSSDDNFQQAASIIMRERLSREYRGNDAARLSVDRRIILEEEILHLPPREAVDLLVSKATPVVAPNGVPIFRVDRGGEVTFHGPNQLVVYPILDLKRDPYKTDLHWFLRHVEEVVIQTLGHYDIEGVRDEINTGM